MIDEGTYEQLLNNFGSKASWAIWQRPGYTPKSNTGDMSVFDTQELLSSLNPKYVFVGLNASDKHDVYLDYGHPWFNFHSSSPYGNDFKLRYALLDTPYWGAYITDAIKTVKEVDSSKVMKYLKEHPEIATDNFETLKRELSYLCENPILIALGKDTYSLLNKYLHDSYEIIAIPHFSARMGKETYRKLVLSHLSEELPANNHVENAPMISSNNANESDGEEMRTDGFNRKTYVDKLAEHLSKVLSHEVITDELFAAEERRVRRNIKGGYREDFIHCLRRGKNYNLFEIYIGSDLTSAQVLVKEPAFVNNFITNVKYSQDYAQHHLLRYRLHMDTPTALKDNLIKFMIDAEMHYYAISAE